MEGFAEFIPLTIKDYLKLPNPNFYRWNGGTKIAAGRRYDDLEINYKVWGDEEFAIAGILWDLYDGESWTDNDSADLTLAEVWNLLNRQNNLDLKALYDTFKGSGISDLTEDFNNNSLSDLDEIFISHGAFNDSNDNRVWEPGEEVGYTGNSARPYRRNKPLRNDSFLYLVVIDNSTGSNVNNITLSVVEKNDYPYEIYDHQYSINVTGLPGLVYYSMLPTPSIANITARKGCYISSEPLLINSSFYWDNINTGRGYLVNHTFYMVPDCLGDATGDCKVDIFDLASVGLCYGKTPSGSCQNADINNDGAVNIFDLATVGLNYGRTC